jgi:hypothetical protein
MTSGQTLFFDSWGMGIPLHIKKICASSDNRQELVREPLLGIQKKQIDKPYPIE